MLIYSLYTKLVGCSFTMTERGPSTIVSSEYVFPKNCSFKILTCKASVDKRAWTLLLLLIILEHIYYSEMCDSYCNGGDYKMLHCYFNLSNITECFLHHCIFIYLFRFLSTDLLQPACKFMFKLSAAPAQHPLLAPPEQLGSGRWLQPAGSRRTAQAELSATPVLH